MPNASDFLGEASEDKIRDWLVLEWSRCTDPEWAEIWMPVQAVLPHLHISDFLNRTIDIGDAAILAGVRFYGGDLDRAFVNIVACCGEIDWVLACAVIRREWANFQPRQIRILTASMPTNSVWIVDQTIHAGRISDMARRPARPDVLLKACDDPEEAARCVAFWYDQIAADTPDIAAEISPCDAAELAACGAKGTLHWIKVGGRRAGVIATQPGHIEMMPGHIVYEIVLDREFRGRGLAKFAQQRLAEVMQQDRRKSDLITGTIHRLNVPSRKSATAAGRDAILKYLFLSL